jgi:hypothetical protein
VIEIKIPTPRAMGKIGKRQRHPPGIKPSVACVASPWTAPGECEREIHHSGSMRAETIRAAALRANHRLRTSVMRDRITKSFPLGNNLDVRCCYTTSVK